MSRVAFLGFAFSRSARRQALKIMAVVLGVAALAAPAQAQLARTFVSAATGNDANDCSRGTPCRTFQTAHDKTFDQGEITVLDPGGYGAVTITKSISIINDGVGEAGVLVSGGATAVTVNASNANVSLRGLTVQGIGFGGGSGIHQIRSSSLSISNCLIRNLTGFGIDFEPTADARLAVSNTLITDNQNVGIFVLPNGASAVRVDLNHVEVHNSSTDGILLLTNVSPGTINATIADSVSAGHVDGNGINAETVPGSAGVTVMVVRSTFSNSRAAGLSSVGPGARVMIGQSTVSGNATSWTARGNAVLQSFGDNYIGGNGDGDPAPPVIARK